VCVQGKKLSSFLPTSFNSLQEAKDEEGTGAEEKQEKQEEKERKHRRHISSPNIFGFGKKSKVRDVAGCELGWEKVRYEPERVCVQAGGGRGGEAEGSDARLWQQAIAFRVRV